MVRAAGTLRGRDRRPYSPRQKQAALESSRRRRHTDEVRSIHLFGSRTGAAKGGTASAINSYLVEYNARLIEIDHRYPLGHPERAEWIETHRRMGVKRLKEIMQIREDELRPEGGECKAPGRTREPESAENQSLPRAVPSCTGSR